MFTHEQTNLAAEILSVLPMNPPPEDPPPFMGMATPIDPIPEIEAFIASIKGRPLCIYIDSPKVTPKYIHTRSGLDMIHMRLMRYYKTRQLYYHTIFHELIHSTGHASRLSRLETPEGIYDNASITTNAQFLEECIAEIGAAFLLLEFNLNSPTRNRNSGIYLRNHMEKLRLRIPTVETTENVVLQAKLAADYLVRRSCLNHREPSIATDANAQTSEATSEPPTLGSADTAEPGTTSTERTV